MKNELFLIFSWSYCNPSRITFMIRPWSRHLWVALMCTPQYFYLRKWLSLQAHFPDVLRANFTKGRLFPDIFSPIMKCVNIFCPIVLQTFSPRFGIATPYKYLQYTMYWAKLFCGPSEWFVLGDRGPWSSWGHFVLVQSVNCIRLKPGALSKACGTAR